MNRKIMARIISGRLATAELLEADYGVTAFDTLHAETAAGRKVDFLLMDFVMVSIVSCLTLHVFSFYFYYV
jgi:hypothetical protein